MATLGDARVSTRTQDVGVQVTQLGAAGVVDVRTETGSGAGRRPVLDELLTQLDTGDVLVVAALDRLGRVGRSLLALVDDLAERGVGLRALRGGFDATDPVAGRIILYVLAALAEAERTLVVERTRAGLAAASSSLRAPPLPPRPASSASHARPLARHLT